MRVSPVGFLFDDIDSVMFEAQKSAEVTHNHPEGIKGAQATAVAIFLAKNGHSKLEIKNYISKYFGYDLDRTLNQIRPTYEFDLSCKGSVPVAIISFLESSDFEDAIRNAISIGGDSDTIACICGGIAQAYYKEIPLEIIDKAMTYLPDEIIKIIKQFHSKNKPFF